MPFDATTLPLSNQITDRLVAIGIVPVPLTEVEEHKRKVIMNFSTSMRGRGLVRTGVAIWRTLHLYRNLEILECPRKHVGMTDDVSAAPRPIIQLAERVSREMRDAEFELEWFYTDPIVNVVCSGHRACLGIWDNGRVVAIADHDGYVPPVTIADRSASFWRRWLRLR
jgi:hypothetical protein